MLINGRRWAGVGAAAGAAALLLLGFGASAQEAKKPAKVVSACKGLEEKACRNKSSECLWVAPKKGKQKAYCRLKSKKKT